LFVRLNLFQLNAAYSLQLIHDFLADNSQLLANVLRIPWHERHRVPRAVSQKLREV
jgi:hypothetical protein